MAAAITFLLLLTCASTAHLPAIRRARLHDEKRVLASKLIRSADKHKERSLRDVLGESDAPTATETSGRDEQRRKMRAEKVATERYPKGNPVQKETSNVDTATENARENDASSNIRTMSQLFAWAINNTATGVTFSYSRKLSTGSASDETYSSHQEHRQSDSDMTTTPGDLEHMTHRKALPDNRQRQKAAKGRRRRKAADLGSSRDDFDLLNSAAESEFDVIRRNVHVLEVEQESPRKKVSALLVLEELCHSIDNGRDLQISGGIRPVLESLHSPHETVRANAAWALATCCQNNPPVQNASLTLGAVPILSRLAATDMSTTVRAKALFALNALLELENARMSFEELPYAIDVLRNALVDSSDYRATRRALNLTELLVQRNLDAWKTQLEAYDIPVIIELLMRSHPDIDVRESAARTIAALDGRHVA